jgi:hypothetical protein
MNKKRDKGFLSKIKKKIYRAVKESVEKLIHIFSVLFSVMFGGFFIIGSLFLSVQPIIDNIIGGSTIFRFAPNFICWFGGIIGTIFIMIPIMKWYHKTHDTIPSLQKKIKTLNNKINKINEKKSEKVMIDFKPVFQLGLFEFKTGIDIYRENIIKEKTGEKGFFKKDKISEREEYNSIIKGSKKIRFGFDFSNIFIAEDGNKILISGVKGICLGVSNLEIEWQHSKIYNKKSVNKTIQKEETMLEHQDMKTEIIKDVEAYLKDVNEAHSIDSHLTSKLEASGKMFIELLLKQFYKNKKIEFIKGSIDDSRLEALPISDLLYRIE